MKNYKNLAEKIKSMKWKCDGENGCGYDGTNEDTQYLCGGPVTMKGLQLHQIIRVRNLALEELLNSLPDQEQCKNVIHIDNPEYKLIEDNSKVCTPENCTLKPN